jgi:ankyrin repeat protein
MKKVFSILFLVILPVTFLIAATQNIDERNRRLRGAIIMGKTAEVKGLIKTGIDVNDKFDVGQNRGLTPLVLVAQFGKADIGKLLIDAGADVNIIFQGLTLLHVAAFSPAGNKAVTELFIAEGLNVNAKCTAEVRVEIEGMTPLHFAAGMGKVEVAETLIKNGAKVDAKDSYYQFTPLHEAAKNKHKAVAELLIAKGADVNAVSKRDGTPLDLAVSKGNEELAELLRKHGGISKKK